jgi:hypothetical protein
VSDRLEELRRQRALQRQQLDWIDREIAALEEAARRDPGIPPPLAPETALSDEDLQAESILRQYAQPQVSIHKQTKYGCILYLGLALALLALGLAAVYLHARVSGPR